MKLKPPTDKERQYTLKAWGWELLKQLKCKGRRVRMGTKVTCLGEGNEVFTVFRMRNAGGIVVLSKGKRVGKLPRDLGSVYLLNTNGQYHGWEAIDKCTVI